MRTNPTNRDQVMEGDDSDEDLGVAGAANHPDQDNIVPELDAFGVLDNYDGGFLPRGRVTNISELTADRERVQTDRLTTDLFNSPAKRQKAETRFLWGMLMRVSVPNSKNSNDGNYSAFKKNRFDRRPKPTANYKRSLHFADLGDEGQQTFVILEENNEQHNLLFKRDLSLANVKVGNRCAILTPKFDGSQLKNGAWVITTNRPLEFLSGPRIPRRPLRSERIGHEIRYFVLKGRKIMVLQDDNVDPVKTKCNFHTCDRLNCQSTGNSGCGCWVQNRRTDNGPRNTVLMFSFYFQDSNGRVQKVTDFTSLHTSKLFFQGKNILADTDTLQNNQVYEYLQDKWRDTIDHVNNNGGFTLIGWYIRATVEDEEKDEQDEDLYRANVKINVSYLYPSKMATTKIPEDLTMKQTEISDLMKNSESSTANGPDEEDRDLVV